MRRRRPSAGGAAVALLSAGLFGVAGTARASDDPGDFFAPAAPPPVATAASTAPAPSGSPAPTPRADAPLGSRGQVVLGGSSNVNLSATTSDVLPASSLQLSFSPTAEYFVLRRLSLGLAVNLAYNTSRGALARSTMTILSAGPRVGLDVPLGDVVSFWPRLTFGIESTHRDVAPVPGVSASAAGPLPPTTNLWGPTLHLRVPLVLEVSPHVLVDVGPTLYHEFGPAEGVPGTGGQRTTVGASAFVGGYFGGDAPAQAAPGGPAPPPARLGRARQLVLTSDASLAASYSAYAGSASSLTTLVGSLAADFFVVDHVSLGFVGSASLTRPVTATRGSAYSETDASFSLGPRLGVLVPLGPRWSLYPTAAITFGPSQSVPDGGGQTSSSFVDLTLLLPLLFPVASHFFVGLGPSLARDLMRTVTSPQGTVASNPRTTLGAEVLLGGWL